MRDVVVDVPERPRATRRHWLAHCSRIVALAALAPGLPARAQGQAPLILVVGDSLSAEYGLARGTGWVALLEQRLAREKIAARVVNASVSGDTTSAAARACLRCWRSTNRRTSSSSSVATTRCAACRCP
jgi:acyl-CoA thioesterase-1